MVRPRPIHLADGLFRLFPGRRCGAPAGVLVAASGGLGDAVLLAVVWSRFACLARAGEPIWLLLRADAAQMGFLFPPEVRPIAVDHRRLNRDPFYRFRIFRRLYKLNVRLAISADHLRHPDLDEALVFACRAREIAAMEPRDGAKHGRRLRANRRRYHRLWNGGPARRDKVLRWAAFADWLGGRSAPALVVRLPAEQLPSPAPDPTPTVIMQPFSAVARKQSPPDLWRRIIAAVPADHRVVIVGAPADLERNPAYRAFLDPPRVRFDGARFAQLMPVLRAARLVVSVDTALMHLAIAAGAPTLGLLSAAFVGEIVPYASEITPPNAHFLYHSMPCEGCLGACVWPPEDGMYPCVARLDGDRAVAMTRALLGEA